MTRRICRTGKKRSTLCSGMIFCVVAYQLNVKLSEQGWLSQYVIGTGKRPENAASLHRTRISGGQSGQILGFGKRHIITDHD